MSKNFSWKTFIIVTFLVSIWVNASEVFRYFIFVMPKTREYLSMVPNVADMNFYPIFLIWGAWDTLLTALSVYLYWLYSRCYGDGIKSVFIAGTISWMFFFVLFWVGLANMNLSTWSLLFITLPLSWIEMVVASFIASKLFKYFSET